jgi:hypothetical protein
MSFFNKGFDQLEQIEQAQAANAATGKLWRFWMKPESETNIIFLDDDPPILEEHQLKLNGKWNNFFTCRKVLGEECPLCNAGDKPYTVGFFPIIDRTEFSRKSGERAKDTPRVLAAKFKTLKQLRKLSKKYGGLTGVEFNVERTSNKSPSVGDIFIKEDDHDTAAVEKILNKKLAEVIPNWDEYLAPQSEADLRKIAGGAAADSSTDEELEF